MDKNSVYLTNLQTFKLKRNTGFCGRDTKNFEESNHCYGNTRLSATDSMKNISLSKHLTNLQEFECECVGDNDENFVFLSLLLKYHHLNEDENNLKILKFSNINILTFADINGYVGNTLKHFSINFGNYIRIPMNQDLFVMCLFDIFGKNKEKDKSLTNEKSSFVSY